MGLINCFVKISVVILSITPSLSAHTLPTESIFPRAGTPEEHTWTTYNFKFHDEQGKPLSEKDAASIKVFTYNHHHHPNKSAETSYLQKRGAVSTPIDEKFCTNARDDYYLQSKCLPAVSTKDWELECFAGVEDGRRYGPYTKTGACRESEICIEEIGGLIGAYCVSHENFVQLALTRTSGDNHKFYHRVANELPANTIVQLRATDSKTNAKLQTHLEMSAQHCVQAIGNIDQCGTVQYAACDYCMKDVLYLTKTGANRITFLARFYRPGINLYLDIFPTKT